MTPLVRALRFLASRRGLATVAAIRKARAMGREWFPVRVTGISMIPTLRPGDLLAVRALRPGEPRAGQIVVATADRLELVKRVVGVPGERGLGPGEYWLEGDNARASTDSRSSGPVRLERIAGVVRARYWPAARARVF